MQALSLMDEVAGLWAAADLPPATERALRVRQALTRSEIAALFCRLTQAEQELAAARALLITCDDVLAEGDALLTEAVVAKARGQRERELEAYDRAAACFELRQGTGRAEVARLWAAFERAFGAPETELILVEQALEGLPRSTDFEEPGLAMLRKAALGLALSRREPAKAAEFFLQASEQAQQVGLLRLAVVCTINAGAALQGLAEYGEAAACYGWAGSVARRTGWPALVGASQTRLGAFLKEIGRLEDARTVLCEALVSLAATPGGINKANACAELAQTLLALGRGVEAVAPIADAIAMYRAAHSSDNLALNLLVQARAWSAAGQPEPALAAIAEAQGLIERHGLTALAVGVCDCLAELHRRHQLPAPAGMKAPTAQIHYAQATLLAGRLIEGWKPPAALFVGLAQAWALAGDMAQAYEFSRQALVVREQELAALLGRSLAALTLDDGQAAANDAASWRPAARRGLPTQAPPADAALQLTPKEQAILRFLALGYANKEIASALAVSAETVKSHLKRLFGKLAVGSRKQAVSRARSMGVPDQRS